MIFNEFSRKIFSVHIYTIQGKTATEIEYIE